MKSFAAFFVGRLRWLHLPGALLITLLQRTPVVRVAEVAEGFVLETPVGAMLKSAVAALGALGAVHTLAGATTLSVSSGSVTGVTVTSGTPMGTIAIGTKGTDTQPLSWNIQGTFPPGLRFLGSSNTSTTTPGILNTPSGVLGLTGTPTSPGTYSLQLTAYEGQNGTLISAGPYPYTVTVVAGAASPPSFTTQPASQTVNLGGTATFTVGVAGSPTPTLQWSKGGSAITGATNATLTINNVATTDGGSYTVVATNASGTATSNAATLTVNVAPVAPNITTQPVGQTVTAGSTVTFSVVVAGQPAPTYQWRKDGIAINGATNASLTLTNVQPGDAANYSVVATNSAGSATSNNAGLSVSAGITAPSITTQPQSQTVSSGAAVAFTVVATGSPAPTFQWQKNGTVIAGATGSTYSISSAQTTDSGNYAVLVTNAGGTATSNTVTLTVNAASAAPLITTQPISLSTGVNQSVTFSVVATGNPAPTYQWFKNGVQLNGANGASFTIGSVQLSDAGNYVVTASNTFGTATSAGASLTVNATVSAPTFTVLPVAQTVAKGSTVVFSAAANGSPTPSYQWKLNNTPIAGATSPLLVVSNPGDANAGAYTCVASNSVGNTTSAAATLTLVTTANPGRLINLSIITTLATGESMSMGTVLGGAGTIGTKQLLVRAAGPSLTTFGVSNPLPDPQMSLIGAGQAQLAYDDNWGGDPTLAAIISQVGAFPFASSTSKDAAIYQGSLANGNYAAQITDTGTGKGTVLAEIYDATPPALYTATTPRLINVSVIKQIATNDSLSAGFVIGGTTAKTVLVRAIGPGLVAFGVGGLMTDPQLAIINNGTTIASNDNWGGDPQLTAAGLAVGAFRIADTGSTDAMLLVTLQPNVTYSATVHGAGGAGGNVLVEVYEVP